MRMQTGIPSADEKYFVIFAQTPTILYSHTSSKQTFVSGSDLNHIAPLYHGIIHLNTLAVHSPEHISLFYILPLHLISEVFLVSAWFHHHFKHVLPGHSAVGCVFSKDANRLTGLHLSRSFSSIFFTYSMLFRSYRISGSIRRGERRGDLGPV